MTSIFASWTLGAALLFSAVKNMSLIQLVKGEPGPGQPASIVDAANARAVVGTAVKGTGTGSKSDPLEPSGGTKGSGRTSAKGLAKWTNPDGSTVLIAKWIYFELKRVGWHGYIESGYRSYQEQVEVCATGVKPCATPGTSNHQGKVFPKGAIDVRESEASGLSAKLQAVHSPLVYAGSKDPVHFSHPHNGSY